MKLDQTLKSMRKLNGWTQEQLAKRVGLKRSLIGAYEEGRAEPKIESLLAFSKLNPIRLNKKTASRRRRNSDRGNGSKGRVNVVLLELEFNAFFR